MEEGFLLDRGHGNTLSQSEWVGGTPEKSFWGGIRVKGRNRIKAETYRCPRCGFLQSYARDLQH